jgi:hypothetical protein
MATVDSLRIELDTYEREKVRLLYEGRGKYALIHGTEVAGIWNTYGDALTAGYERFGLEPFLVKQIQAVERVEIITRLVSPCHP